MGSVGWQKFYFEMSSKQNPQNGFAFLVAQMNQAHIFCGLLNAKRLVRLRLNGPFIQNSIACLQEINKALCLFNCHSVHSVYEQLTK